MKRLPGQRSPEANAAFIDDVTTQTVRLQQGQSLTFTGERLVGVETLNHDDTVRRQFRVYRCDSGYVAERVDSPGTIDVRYWGSRCANADELYDFFGNEPLANYLYGVLGIEVPGLRVESYEALDPD